MDEEKKVSANPEIANNTPKGAPTLKIPGLGKDAVLQGFDENTINKSRQLMKDLARFTSKREEILNRLGNISERMQARMEKEPMEPSITEEMFNSPRHSVPNPIFTKIGFTRIAETKAPICLPRQVIIYMPKPIAMTDEWFERLTTLNRPGSEKKYALPLGRIEKAEDSITIGPGSYANIATGVKLCVPDGSILIPETYNPCLELVSPKTLPYDNLQELEVTVKNISVEDITIKSDEPLVFMRCIQAHDIMGEEMLNSTYSDYVKGAIK